MHNRIIINADDCGKSVDVNAGIEECIQKGYISSTTVMANMEDLGGAKVLYDKYKETISFGAHLDLTEAHPLTKSQLLLDFGYFKETEEGVLMCGHNFRHTIFPKKIREEIFKELDAQMTKLLDYGFSISHIDSHRHIHYGYGILPVFVKVAEKYHINKMRRSKNFMKPCLHLYMGKAWRMELGFLDANLSTVDYFTSFSDYYNKTKRNILLRNNSLIELMVHPGHTNYSEENLLLASEFNKIFNDDLIINYNQI